MTSPGPSPPRSKKGSSDADEVPEAPVAEPSPRSFRAVVSTPDVAVPQTMPRHVLDVPALPVEATAAVADDKPDRTVVRRAAKEAKREAKARARTQRAEARQKLADEKARARADAIRARQAELVDSETADQISPEVRDLDESAPLRVDAVEEALTKDTSADDAPLDAAPLEQITGELAIQDSHGEPVRDDLEDEAEAAGREADQAVAAQRSAKREAKARGREARRESEDRVRRERAEAKAADQRAKEADRAAREDHIVEAPREPKTPLVQRLRGSRSKQTAPSPPPDRSTKGRSGRGRRVVSILAGVVGALGLICSVILAFGALLVALDADGGTLYDVVSNISDALVGPLRDAFSFSGTNAEMKESLVAWGAGSIVYLLVGMVAQSLLRSVIDD